MRIELENLGKSGEFRQTVHGGDLRLDDSDLRVIDSAEVTARVDRRGEEVALSGHLRATVEAACARCLKPVQVPIDLEFSERFVPAVSWRSDEQHELQEKDLDLAVFDGTTIELSDLVREEILLATPAHVLCREDCQGLCPVCGVDRNEQNCKCENRNIDSRWQALEDLRF